MAVIVTDDFNRANSTGLGADWTDVANGFNVASNQATSRGGSANNLAVFTGASWTGGNDHYAEAAIQAKSAAADAAAACRCSTTPTNAYIYDVNDTDAVALGGSMECQLYSVVGAGPAFTALGSPVTETVSAGDVIRTDANGTTIRGLRNGVQKVSVTNGALATGKPGLWAFSTTATFDSFAAGDFSADVVRRFLLVRR
jgi:hypothetical protein